MPRYVAFLRGVSPMNLKMVDFKRCLETADYNKVKAVLSSGNPALDSSSKSAAVIERQIAATFAEQSGRSTIARSVKELQDLIENDPYSRFALPITAKRVVTFARKLPGLKSRLPIEKGRRTNMKLFLHTFVSECRHEVSERHRCGAVKMFPTPDKEEPI